MRGHAAESAPTSAQTATRARNAITTAAVSVGTSAAAVIVAVVVTLCLMRRRRERMRKRRAEASEVVPHVNQSVCCAKCARAAWTRLQRMSRLVTLNLNIG